MPSQYFPPRTGGASAAAIWAYATRTITEQSTTATVTWYQATGIVEADLLDIPVSVTEVVIDIRQMSLLELPTQVITFRIYRNIGGVWTFDDSVEVVPSEKEVITLSNVHGHSKITMQPALITVGDYVLPYVNYNQ